MNILTNYDLKSANTLGLTSVCHAYSEVSQDADLDFIFATQTETPRKLYILGSGSNLVISPEISGWVLKIANKGIEILSETSQEVVLKVSAGEIWNDFVTWSLQHNFFGAENLSLIPGTVGASPIQNIGAYGVEVKDLIEEVVCFDLQTGKFIVLDNSSCNFSYRDSYFKNAGAGRFIVWEVIFRLSKDPQVKLEYGDIKAEISFQNWEPTPQNVSRAVINIRQKKLPDPAKIGNAGSFFKNPIVSSELRNALVIKFPQLVSYPYGSDHYKLAAGWLIDSCGWKGKSLGPVGMFEKQALVLVNHGQANSDDVWKLAQAVKSDIKNKFNVEIEAEPIKW